jgi:hypothetical protein
MLIDGIRRAGVTGGIIYQADDSCLRSEDRGILSLHNAYAEYSVAPDANRKSVVRKRVRGWFRSGKEIPEEYEDVRPDPLPAVRGQGGNTRSTPSARSLRQGSSGTGPALKPVGQAAPETSHLAP